MKKFLYVILSLGIGLLAHLILNRYLSYYGIGPQLLLLLVVANAFLLGPLMGETLGFFWGLIVDSMAVSFFGLNSLVFTVAGFVCGHLRRRVASERPSAQLVIALVASLYYFVSVYFLKSGFGSGEGWVYGALVVFGTFLNVLLATAVFWITEFWVWMWKMHQENL